MEIYALYFIIGLCFGSFANVLIFRIPRNLSILHPSSYCTTCKTPLKWRDKIPLLSFLFLRGHCRYCQSKISLVYPLSELLGGIFALFCVIFLPLESAIPFFFILVLFYALSLIDIEFLAIPDSLNFILFFSALNFGIWDSTFLALARGLCFLGFASFLRLLGGSLFKKEVLGEGDLLIFGSIGCMLEVFFGTMAIFLSALYALLFYCSAWMLNKHSVAIPFVPFLFLGFLSAFLAQIL